MRFVMFYHSLVSDWNHGNAHFLRGMVRALEARGHDVAVYEPADGWSRANLLLDHGDAALAEFHTAYPGLHSQVYDLASLDLDRALAGADVVIVHEWNDAELVAALGRHRRRARYRLLFHDTHHRAVSQPEAMAALALEGYDGVLAFGQVLAAHYAARGFGDRAFTLHEAADTRVFYPRPPAPPAVDVVWIGNWGDGERTAELEEFFIEPVRSLGLSAVAYGVRYPAEALAALAAAGIRYRGWLPNHRVPAAFAGARATIHVPRRLYTRQLPGIPTIRPFEAMACGMPLVSAPWTDSEGLFRAGRDYLVADDGAAMKRHLRALLDDPAGAAALGRAGLAHVRSRHTCGHRADELLQVVASLSRGPEALAS